MVIHSKACNEIYAHDLLEKTLTRLRRLETHIFEIMKD
jgi:hypothetical protein